MTGSTVSSSDAVLCMKLYQESAKGVDSTVGERRKEQLLKTMEGSKNIYNADQTGLFFRLPPNKTVSSKGDPCNGGKNSKERIMVLLA
jgi:hypothetical protein